MTKQQLLTIKAGDVFTVRPRGGGYVMLHEAPLSGNWAVTCHRLYDVGAMAIGIALEKTQTTGGAYVVRVFMADMGMGWLVAGNIDEVF